LSPFSPERIRTNHWHTFLHRVELLYFVTAITAKDQEMKTLRQNSAILRRAALSGTGQSSIAGGAGGVVIKRLTKLCCWEFYSIATTTCCYLQPHQSSIAQLHLKRLSACHTCWIISLTLSNWARLSKHHKARIWKVHDIGCCWRWETTGKSYKMRTQKKKGGLLGSQSPKNFTPDKSEINICSQFQ
jgi:hypothetical protein